MLFHKNEYEFFLNNKYKYTWYLVPKVGSLSILYWLLDNNYLNSIDSKTLESIEKKINKQCFTSKMLLHRKEYNSFINHKYKYIWYLVSKVASRSVLYWLWHNNYIDSIDPKNEIKLNKQYFTFAFCRNPFDRLVSTYFDRVKNHTDSQGLKRTHPFYNQWIDKDFATFVSDVCNMPNCKMDYHLFPQIYFIPRNIDFIGRFENFQKDFEFVTNKLFNKKFDNRKYNPTERSHYSEYYDDNLRIMVYNKYKKDFKRFGYSF